MMFQTALDAKMDEEIDRIIADRKADSALIVRSPIDGTQLARLALDPDVWVGEATARAQAALMGHEVVVGRLRGAAGDQAHQVVVVQAGHAVGVQQRECHAGDTRRPGVGIDPRIQLIPVAPACHYHMGGIATDTEGQTSLRGLFASWSKPGTGSGAACR